MTPSRGTADASARELLELQESLSGNTSEADLGDLQTAVRVYWAAGDSARALPPLRKAVTIGGVLAAPANDWRPRRLAWKRHSRWLVIC